MMFLFCSVYKRGTALLLQPWPLSFPCPSRRLGHGTNFKMHAGLILQRADDAEQVFGGGGAVRSGHAHQAPWRTSKPFFGPEETGLKPGSAIDHSLENGG